MIVVGVALDTVQQIESHLLTRHYEGFTGPGAAHPREKDAVGEEEKKTGNRQQKKSGSLAVNTMGNCVQDYDRRSRRCASPIWWSAPLLDGLRGGEAGGHDGRARRGRGAR